MLAGKCAGGSLYYRSDLATALLMLLKSQPTEFIPPIQTEEKLGPAAFLRPTVLPLEEDADEEVEVAGFFFRRIDLDSLLMAESSLDDFAAGAVAAGAAVAARPGDLRTAECRDPVSELERLNLPMWVTFICIVLLVCTTAPATAVGGVSPSFRRLNFFFLPFALYLLPLSNGASCVHDESEDRWVWNC